MEETVIVAIHQVLDRALRRFLIIGTQHVCCDIYLITFGIGNGSREQTRLSLYLHRSTRLVLVVECLEGEGVVTILLQSILDEERTGMDRNHIGYGLLISWIHIRNLHIREGGIGRNCPVQADGTRKSLGCNSRSINSLWSSCITLIFEIGDIAITGSQGCHSN